MISRNTFIKGLKAGLNTTWELGKIVFPVTIFVKILTFTPIIHWIIYLFTPLMKGFGLPGEAAIPLVLGKILNLYAAIGAIISLDLTVKNVFILAVMLSFSHNLIVETAVAKKIGIRPIVPIALRLGLAFTAGFMINMVWHGGQEIAQFTTVAVSQSAPNTWVGIGILAMTTAVKGILEIAMIVFPLMIGIQILKDIQAIAFLADRFEPMTKILGLSSGKTSVPLLAGIIFGLAYGAGVIIDSAKEENLSKKDLYLLSVFLVSSHAVIEDTLIFIPLGINVIYLLIIRVTVAFIITMITANVWRKLIVHTELVTKGEAK